jgi:glycolate oxidase iron-sulfur subunit
MKTEAENIQLNGVYDETLRCNRCGFCQTNCPVYRVTGIESSAARGHNAHVRGIIEGRMGLIPELRDPIFECLLCRACTANCFPAVETDRIIVAAREAYIEKYGQPRLQRYIFRELLPDRAAMDRAVKMAFAGKRAGISRIAVALSLFGWFGRKMARAESMARDLPRRFLREMIKEGSHAEIRWGNDAAYFLGCGFNYSLPQAGLATLRCLNAMGLSVNLLDNVCCGLPPYSHGDIEAARLLARNNIDLMTDLDEKWIVTECGSCSSFLKMYESLLVEEPGYLRKAQDLRGKIVDLSELIHILGGVDSLVGTRASRCGPVRTVSYHDPCHLSRHQGIVEQPREILTAIPGLEFREMKEADWCCGGAGVYTILHPQRSDSILDRKMNNFSNTEGEILVTSCPACMVQLRQGVRKRGMDARVLHLSQVMEEAFWGPAPGSDGGLLPS